MTNRTFLLAAIVLVGLLSLSLPGPNPRAQATDSPWAREIRGKWAENNEYCNEIKEVKVIGGQIEIWDLAGCRGTGHFREFSGVYEGVSNNVLVFSGTVFKYDCDKEIGHDRAEAARKTANFQNNQPCSASNARIRISILGNTICDADDERDIVYGTDVIEGHRVKTVDYPGRAFVFGRCGDRRSEYTYTRIAD